MRREGARFRAGRVAWNQTPALQRDASRPMRALSAATGRQSLT